VDFFFSNSNIDIHVDIDSKSEEEIVDVLNLKDAVKEVIKKVETTLADVDTKTAIADIKRIKVLTMDEIKQILQMLNLDNSNSNKDTDKENIK
jgi:hypothetical protein